MAKFCDQCGTELGLLGARTLTRSDGSTVAVCRACASQAATAAAAAPPLASPTPPGPGDHP